MANATIMPAAIAVARTVITLSRLWIILFWGLVFAFLGGYWLLGFSITHPDTVGWDDIVEDITQLACLTVALMPRYFVRKYSIIQTACILLCVIAIGRSISVFDALREGDLLYIIGISIVALLVILVELICLKKFFVAEASPLSDDLSSLDEERINRFILIVLLFLTVIISTHTILSLGGMWVQYLMLLHVALTAYGTARFLGIGAVSLLSGEISLTSYPHPWRRVHKSFCTLNMAIGIIGHQVILTSVVVGIWINGYPAEWLL